MVIFISILVLLSHSFASALNTCQHDERTFRCVSVVSVYDGDTFTPAIPNVHPFFTRVRVRINGIDTPEMKGKCKEEKALAVKARDRLAGLIQGRTITLSNVKWGKWAGRLVGDVYVDGENVADTLIKENLARRYLGKGKRLPWCKIQS